jgi:hypothetical protein
MVPLVQVTRVCDLLFHVMEADFFTEGGRRVPLVGGLGASGLL